MQGSGKKLHGLLSSYFNPAALRAGEERETALEEFYKKWAQEPLVVLKWLSLKAGSNAPGNVKATRELTKHSAFNINNPNNCYSLYMAFCRSHPNFHAEDGSGYEFLADSVIQVRHRAVGKIH